MVSPLQYLNHAYKYNCANLLCTAVHARKWHFSPWIETRRVVWSGQMLTWMWTVGMWTVATLHHAALHVRRLVFRQGGFASKIWRKSQFQSYKDYFVRKKMQLKIRLLYCIMKAAFLHIKNYS